MNKLQTGIITASLVFSSFALPLAAGAQGTQDNGTLNNQSQPNQSQPGSANDSGGNTGNTQTSPSNNDQGFDWRWLLPLLAIPVIYLFIRRNDTDDRDESRDQRRYMTGAKGGRSRKDEEDYEVDDEK